MANWATASKERRTQQTTSAQTDQDEIGKVAYALFEQRGGEHGHDFEDWLKAEVIVRQRKRTGHA